VAEEVDTLESILNQFKFDAAEDDDLGKKTTAPREADFIVTQSLSASSCRATSATK
jgi:hypothetical protein